MEKKEGPDVNKELKQGDPFEGQEGPKSKKETQLRGDDPKDVVSQTSETGKQFRSAVDGARVDMGEGAGFQPAADSLVSDEVDTSAANVHEGVTNQNEDDAKTEADEDGAEEPADDVVEGLTGGEPKTPTDLEDAKFSLPVDEDEDSTPATEDQTLAESASEPGQPGVPKKTMLASGEPTAGTTAEQVVANDDSAVDPGADVRPGAVPTKLATAAEPIDDGVIVGKPISEDEVVGKTPPPTNGGALATSTAPTGTALQRMSVVAMAEEQQIAEENRHLQPIDEQVAEVAARTVQKELHEGVEYCRRLIIALDGAAEQALIDGKENARNIALEGRVNVADVYPKQYRLATGLLRRLVDRIVRWDGQLRGALEKDEKNNNPLRYQPFLESVAKYLKDANGKEGENVDTKEVEETKETPEQALASFSKYLGQNQLKVVSNEGDNRDRIDEKTKERLANEVGNGLARELLQTMMSINDPTKRKLEIGKVLEKRLPGYSALDEGDEKKMFVLGAIFDFVTGMRNGEIPNTFYRWVPSEVRRKVSGSEVVIDPADIPGSVEQWAAKEMDIETTGETAVEFCFRYKDGSMEVIPGKIGDPEFYDIIAEKYARVEFSVAEDDQPTDVVRKGEELLHEAGVVKGFVPNGFEKAVHTLAFDGREVMHAYLKNNSDVAVQVINENGFVKIYTKDGMFPQGLEEAFPRSMTTPKERKEFLDNPLQFLDVRGVYFGAPSQGVVDAANESKVATENGGGSPVAKITHEPQIA